MIKLYMRHMVALEFMGMNDVMQLQLLIKKAAGYLEKLRLDYEPAHHEFLENARSHLQACERLLYQLDLPHLFRFTLAKQKAVSTLHLLELRSQIRRRQAGRGAEPLARVTHQGGLLQVVLQYVAPVCCN